MWKSSIKMPLFTYFSCWCVVQSSLAQTEADVVFSVYSSLHFQKSNSITTQLRLERHARVHKLLLNMWCAQNNVM